MTAPKNTAELTSERVRELLDYDPLTGVFTNRIARGPRALEGGLSGVAYGGRRMIRIDYEVYMAHRLAWLYIYESWPQQDIDHIDGDALNNRIANLRDVSRQVNSQNRKRASKSSRHGVLGVSLVRNNAKNPWAAHVKTNGKSALIGCFPTPELAHAAYVEAKRRLHAGNTL